MSDTINIQVGKRLGYTVINDNEADNKANPYHLISPEGEYYAIGYGWELDAWENSLPRWEHNLTLAISLFDKWPNFYMGYDSTNEWSITPDEWESITEGIEFRDLPEELCKMWLLNIDPLAIQSKLEIAIIDEEIEKLLIQKEQIIQQVKVKLND